MKRFPRMFLGSFLLLGIGFGLLWQIYLGPRVRVKKFMRAAQPIVSTQYRSSSKLRNHLEITRKQRVGFYDPDERQKLINQMEKTSRMLGEYRRLTKENAKNINSLNSSAETDKLKQGLDKGMDSIVGATSSLIDDLSYMKSLIVVIDRYNPELKDIRQKTPTTAVEAMAQLDKISVMLVRFDDELNGLKVPNDLTDFHREFSGIFTDKGLIESAREALYAKDLNRLSQLQSRFILMDASMDGRNIESTLDATIKPWVVKESRIFSGPIQAAKKLEKKYGPRWTAKI